MQIRELFGSLKRFDWEAVFNTFLALPARQQTVVLAAAIGVMALLVLVPVGVAVSSLQGLQSEVAAARDTLSSLTVDIQKYRESEGRVGALQKVFAGQSTDSLRTAISRIAGDAGVKVDEMAERGNKESFDFHEEEKGSFQLKNISLKDLVAFLHALETSTQRVIRVKKMIVRPDQKNRQLLNADFSEVAGYRLLNESGAK